MAVDLNDLILPLTREVNPPGSNLYPDAVDDDWLGQLQDSFWEAKLYGFFGNFTEADGLVSPITGTTDLERTLQQLIVLFAGIRSIRMKMVNLNTLFRAKAGPVEFETQNSANLLNTIMKQLQDKIDTLLKSLADSILGGTQTYYINSLIGRDYSYLYGYEEWTGSGSGWGYGF